MFCTMARKITNTRKTGKWLEKAKMKAIREEGGNTKEDRKTPRKNRVAQETPERAGGFCQHR